jgi:hypothetical protein
LYSVCGLLTNRSGQFEIGSESEVVLSCEFSVVSAVVVDPQ